MNLHKQPFLILRTHELIIEAGILYLESITSSRDPQKFSSIQPPPPAVPLVPFKKKNVL